ncbi:hypothetical protein M422DRAFT_245987 [Sphaerobolus stellatus SS14]|nr:hypothetical protein M422DRAFT_245987 [Sphaerobolus stellatus SS14]
MAHLSKGRINLLSLGQKGSGRGLMDDHHPFEVYRVRQLGQLTAFNTDSPLRSEQLPQHSNTPLNNSNMHFTSAFISAAVCATLLASAGARPYPAEDLALRQTTNGCGQPSGQSCN